MKNIFKLLAFLPLLTACDDLFEPALENNRDLEAMYKEPSYAQGILANAYIILPYETSPTSDLATDDAVTNEISSNYLRMATGSWTANNNPVSQWQNRFNAIQYINLFLENVDKVESGVRLRYQYKDPYTGEEEEILIENTETRDQPKNRENAMRQLRSILYDKELQHRMAEQAKVEAGKKKIEWGSQIRSYVFDDRRVKDHRTNYQTSDVNGVMDGKIDGFIKAYLMEFSSQES